MNVHVTREISDVNFGGIGTLLDSFYAKRSKNDIFVLVGSDNQPRPSSLAEDIYYFNLKDYFFSDFDVWNDNNIILHTPQLYRFFKRAKKVILVNHSNYFKESEYSPNVSKGVLDHYLDVCERVDKIILVSEFEKDIFLNTVAKKSSQSLSHKLLVIHNGISLPSEIDNLYKICSRPKTLDFGYLGRLDDRKGIIYLANNFPEQFRLLIASGGHRKVPPDTYQRLCTTLNGRKTCNILLIGYCNQERKKQFFAQIDALIVPSLYEPFGLVVLESIAAGVPVIVPQVGGPKEIVGDYPLVFDPQSRDSLHKAINEFNKMDSLSLEQLMLYLVERLKKFSLDKTLSEYQKL